MGSNEERLVLSRHLASGHTTVAEGTGTGPSTDWLSIGRHHPMGNLASNLRRSMPSVNAGGPANSQHRELRHGSFSIEEEQRRQRERGDATQQPEKAASAATVAGDGTAKDAPMRCTSSASLSPSGSLVFGMAQHQQQQSPNVTSRSVETQATTVLDTRQIQVFLKKREDSRTTIGTEVSDADSGVGGANAKFHHSNAIPPAPPQTVHPSSSSSASASLRHSRKIFRSSDTRSSFFSSVSSSLDSAKEERIVSSLEHFNPSASTRSVVVLPRPRGVAQSPAAEEAEERAAETQSSSGAECRTPVPADPAPMPPPVAHPAHIPPLALSAWHSISDLTPSARLGRRVSVTPNNNQQTQPRGAAGGQVPSSELWSSPPPPRPQSQAGHRRSNYLGELVWQVDETVFCGGIEAVQNQNLLCRLNIEYIVDLSGQEDDPTLSNNRPRTECPCLCARRTAHSRMTMSIRIKDDSHQQLLNRDARPSSVDTKAQLMEREEIVRYFETLIDLIRKARISQKKVLIHSLKGRNRAPAFVAAYLMHCNRVTRVQAINRITKLMSSMRPGLCISDSLQRALMRWQSILGIRAESTRLDTQSLNKMFAVKKTAWI